MKRSFKLQDLDCANCAAKMESAINQRPAVNKATISFMTQKLVLDADVADANALDAVIAEAQAICSSIEPDCKIVH